MMATPSPSPSEFTRDNPPLLSGGAGRHLGMSVLLITIYNYS